MDTNCASLTADLFSYCFESPFKAKLHIDPCKFKLIDKFHNTNRYMYLDDIFALNNSYCFKYTVEIYPQGPDFR